MESIVNNIPFRALLRKLNEATVLDVATLQKALTNVPLSLSDVQSYVLFDPKNYSRNLLYQNERFQILCLGWLAGQGSPVHSHGTSVCAVRVLQGIATERLFQTTTDSEPTEVRTWAVGDTTVSEGGLVHSITNEADHPLITLHVYSPPLVRM